MKFFSLRYLLLINIFSGTATATVSFNLKNPHTRKVTTIRIVQGDILTQKVDAIVNAANEQLLAGGGVCGAIFKAAGKKDLQAACFAYPADDRKIRCATGSAVITPSYALKKRGIKHIIHAVGPDCRIIKNPSDQKRLLAGAYTQSLEEATCYRLRSIAFPFISSAIFACPPQLAARTALKALRDFTQKNPTNSLDTIELVLFSKESYRTVLQEAEEILPLDGVRYEK